MAETKKATSNFHQFLSDSFKADRAHPRKDAAGNVVKDDLDWLGYIGDAIRFANAPAGTNPNVPQAAPAPQASAAAGVPVLDFGMGVNARAPQPGASPDPFSAWSQATIKQESGGNYGAINKETGALGKFQIMPATGKSLAESNGMTWSPNLMTGTTPEAQKYQDTLGALALREAWNAGGQQPAGASTYYYAGPDPKQAGPKTQEYVATILGRLGQAAATPGDPRMAPVGSFVTPGAAMAAIPQPRARAAIDLPEAPQLAMPQARPELEAPDKTDLLAQLTAALTPVANDPSRDRHNRRAGGVTGAVQGGIMGLAGGPVGAILGALLGAYQGQAGVRQGFRDRDDANEAQQRNANILLAQLGLDIDKAGLSTRNVNLDRGWQSGEDARGVENQNLLGADQRAVQEVLGNADVNSLNVGEANRADLIRGQAGIGAAQDAAQIGNAAAAAQSARDVAFGGEKGLQTRTAQILAQVGVPAERTEGAKPDASLDNVRSAASYIAANNVEGALGAFAQEILTSGTFGEVLGDADLKAVRKAIQQKDIASAQAIVNRAVTADPKAALALAQELSKRGLPVAKLISTNAKVR